MEFDFLDSKIQHTYLLRMLTYETYVITINQVLRVGDSITLVVNSGNALINYRDDVGVTIVVFEVTRRNDHLSGAHPSLVGMMLVAATFICVCQIKSA